MTDSGALPLRFSSISSLVETISKKPIPPHVKYITLEIMAEDETEEDVEVSWVLPSRLFFHVV